MKKVAIYKNNKSNIQYYHGDEVKVVSSDKFEIFPNIDYIIVEEKKLLPVIITLYGYEKILKDLIFHDFLIDRAIKYKEFGLKNSDFSVVSNWCGGGYLYGMFGTQNNGPCVWGYTENTDEYIKEIVDKSYFTNEISEIKKSAVNTPIAKIGNTQIYYNHYKTYSDEKIINLHNKRRKKFNRNNFFVFSVAYSIEDVKKLNSEINDPHIILTSFDLNLANVISITNLEQRVSDAKPKELWKYARRYLTTDYDLIEYFSDCINGLVVDINDYKIDGTKK